MSYRGLNDCTGLFPLRQFSHVKIVNPRHAHYLQTGTIVRIKAPRVWIALPGGVVVKAGHRSVEVVLPRAVR